ncbi:MAG: succinate dehydrogenase assembly factor 2 [Dechloromonas sp.]|nr:succinate dehydrogenase assembly factor 2 [Dechloromonas sp.]
MERKDYERLRWRCIRRALLELDITLTRFLDDGFSSLDEVQQQAFVALADLEDYDLWDLITGKAEIDDPVMSEVVAMLRKSRVRLAE